MQGHKQELSKAIFEFSGDFVATSSLDGTVLLWDTKVGKPIVSFDDHSDEVLDIAFNTTGTLLASVGADNEGKIYSVNESRCISTLVGH